VINLSPSKKYI
jgi:hypothetical protein